MNHSHNLEALEEGELEGEIQTTTQQPALKGSRSAGRSNRGGRPNYPSTSIDCPSIDEDAGSTSPTAAEKGDNEDTIGIERVEGVDSLGSTSPLSETASPYGDQTDVDHIEEREFYVLTPSPRGSASPAPAPELFIISDTVLAEGPSAEAQVIDYPIDPDFNLIHLPFLERAKYRMVLHYGRPLLMPRHRTATNDAPARNRHRTPAEMVARIIQLKNRIDDLRHKRARYKSLEKMWMEKWADKNERVEELGAEKLRLEAQNIQLLRRLDDQASRAEALQVQVFEAKKESQRYRTKLAKSKMKNWLLKHKAPKPHRVVKKTSGRATGKARAKIARAR